MLLSTDVFCPASFGENLWRPEDMPDARLYRRLCGVAKHLLVRLEQPTTVQPRALRRGAQRLWNNPRVKANVLRQRAEADTLSHLRPYARIVFAHDTTECDERGAGDPSDAGPLRSSHARGYLVHYAVAVASETHEVLGALAPRVWTRPWELKQQNHRTRPLEEKESLKWSKGIARVTAQLDHAGIKLDAVHVMDREGDVFANFRFARKHNHKVVTRAAQDRGIVEGNGALFAHLQSLPCAFTFERLVDNHANAEARKAAKAQGKQAGDAFEARLAALKRQRTATFELRFATVTLKEPQKRKGRQTVTAIYVTEVDPPAEVESTTWRLLTTCAVHTTEDALQVVDDYRGRWPIEPFNRVLKSGLHLEKERVDSVESFERLVVILLPVAGHLVRWQYAARTTPKRPATEHVEPAFLEQIKEACRYRKVPLPRRVWTIGDVVTKLANLGGYESRPDRVPGWLVLWRGYREVLRLTEAFEYARATVKQAPD